jgi:hypothetical protein
MANEEKPRIPVKVCRGKLKGNTPTINEAVSKERWEPLPERSDDPIPDPVEVREEDANSVSLELINDFQENYSEEQRQNLYQKISDMSSSEKLRLASLANREARKLLIRDSNKMISLNVLKNAKVNESEVLQYAQRRDLAQDIILAISQDQKWRKNYPIKFALVSNPKTPLSVSITFLSHLHERDIKLLSRDKNVSSVLRRRAEEILDRKK